NPAVDQRSCAHPSAKPESAVSPYACQRRTTLNNHNKIFTDALEVLAENLEFCGNQGPSLAFRRAASVLKSLPEALRCLEETQHLPCLGEHCRAIIEGELVDESTVKKMILTFEKRSYKNQELRIKFPDNPENIAVVDLLQELTDIDTLHESEEGAEVLIDALLEGQVVALMVQNMERLDETVKEEADGVYNTLGFLFYEDISKPVSRTEASALKIIVEEAVICVNPSATVSITGGFR
ncbi:hypothetical protein cypCar_00041730, partial [Cyprinus carpio]